MSNKKAMGDKLQAKLALLGVKVNKTQAQQIYDAVFETVDETLVATGRVQVQNFGTFEVVERAARKGRNPQTGEEIDIAAKNAPKFAPAKALKDKVK
ncbi:hypothetical protein LC76P1_00175 [Lysinibacillus phage LC76P1]|nr:hypothetical protein LC76P1_00175 [Lysinibacillus phage LC76P1]